MALKDLSKTNQEKIKKHSSSHKGGMQSKHIRNMIRFMTKGDSFSVAHKKAMEIDKKSKNNKSVKRSYGY